MGTQSIAVVSPHASDGFQALGLVDGGCEEVTRVLEDFLRHDTFLFPFKILHQLLESGSVAIQCEEEDPLDVVGQQRVERGGVGGDLRLCDGEVTVGERSMDYVVFVHSTEDLNRETHPRRHEGTRCVPHATRGDRYRDAPVRSRYQAEVDVHVVRDVEYDPHSVDGVKAEQDMLSPQTVVGEDVSQYQIHLVRYPVVGVDQGILCSGCGHLKLLYATHRVSRVGHDRSHVLHARHAPDCCPSGVPRRTYKHRGPLAALLEEVVADSLPHACIEKQAGSRG